MRAGSSASPLAPASPAQGGPATAVLTPAESGTTVIEAHDGDDGRLRLTVERDQREALADGLSMSGQIEVTPLTPIRGPGQGLNRYRYIYIPI
jgi:hypothetical protein